MFLSTHPDTHARFELDDVGIEFPQFVGSGVVAAGQVVEAFAFAHGGIDGFIGTARGDGFFGDDAFVGFVDKGFAFDRFADGFTISTTGMKATA